MTEYVACPEPACGLDAAVLRRDLLETTSGPLLLVKTVCVNRHHFLMEERHA